MAYDKIDWHAGGDFPEDLPDENGGTHIGMFLAWVASRNMLGEFHHDDSVSELERLEKREITGLQFLMEACDCAFGEDDLNDQGNAFACDYYEGESDFAAEYGSYLQDYCDVFDAYAEEQGFEYPSVYHVEDSWENYERLKPVLDERFAQWQVWRSGQ